MLAKIRTSHRQSNRGGLKMKLLHWAGSGVSYKNGINCYFNYFKPLELKLTFFWKFQKTMVKLRMLFNYFKPEFRPTCHIGLFQLYGKQKNEDQYKGERYFVFDLLKNWTGKRIRYKFKKARLVNAD